MNNIPERVGNLMVITGEQDSVLSHRMTTELREAVARRGGMTLDGEGFDHPFMDTRRIHDRRMATVRDFLMGDPHDSTMQSTIQ